MSLLALSLPPALSPPRSIALPRFPLSRFLLLPLLLALSLSVTRSIYPNLAIAAGIAGLPFQNPYIMQLNQMAAQMAGGNQNPNNNNNGMFNNLPQMTSILAYDPNNPTIACNQATNVYLLANAAVANQNFGAAGNLGVAASILNNNHNNLSTIQQM